MEKTAREKVLQILQVARKTAQKAEQEYDFRAEKLQEDAAKDIDLYGLHMPSQVVDIVSESKKICDSLYASYQSLVGVIDGQCRPLLSQELDHATVRQVRDLIKWLNDESEIENNFTASLNHRDLGDVGGRRYFPSIENKMIQGFWDTQCELYAQKVTADKAPQQDAEQQRQEELEEKCRQARKAYEAEREGWQKQVREVQACRAQKVAAALENELQHMEGAVERAHVQAMEALTKELEQYHREKAQAEALLPTIGFFKFAEKKAAKKAIEAANANIADVENRKKAQKQTYRAEKSALDSKRDALKERLEAEVAREFPLPAEPAMQPITLSNGTVVSATVATNMMIRQQILEGMKPGVYYTREDIRELLPEKLTIQRVAALVRQLEESGAVERLNHGAMIYFCVRK